MKNRILLAALAALTLFAGTAEAGGILRFDRLTWKFPANVTSAPFTQATKALAAGGTDTTVWISTAGWYLPDTPADSVVVARFIIHIDSTAAYAPGQTTITANIDGAVSPQAGGLPNVNTFSHAVTVLPTTGDKLMSIPVLVIPQQGSPTSGGGWLQLPPFIRLRVASSAAINAAGISIQYLSAQ